MSITKKLNQIKEAIPKEVTLVAVSKTQPETAIIEAYQAGQRIFGENKVQEMIAKQKNLPNDIQWHMIGHLQRNKVKYMASFVQLIHGVESFKVLQEINKQAQKHNRIIDCLLQLKIATETTKFGMQVQEAEKIINSEALINLKNIKITGLMGMATFTTDTATLNKEFTTLKSTFDHLKKIATAPNCKLQILSMGMSSDYKLAIACGSTMIRIGSSIFGNRN